MDAAQRAANTKQHRQQEYEKYCNSFSHYLPLWKVDDKEWVAQRKQTWNAIADREKQEDQFFVKTEWENRGRFFQRGKPRINDAVLYPDERIRLTPFDSVDQILEFYRAEHVSHRGRLHENALRMTSYRLRACPAEFHRVELIAKALYNPKWVGCKEPMGIYDRHDYVVTCPRDAVRCYVIDARRHIRYSESSSREEVYRRSKKRFTGQERSYVEITIDYFLSSLAIALDDSYTGYGEVLDQSDFEDMHELAKLAYAVKPDAGNPHTELFIQQMKDRVIPHPLFQQALSVPLSTR